jgi:predicted permease
VTHRKGSPLIIVRRLILWLQRSRLDDQLRDEVTLHIELRCQALIDAGVDPRDAEVEARRLFGNTMAIREETRDMWGFPSIDTLAQDVRYGSRLLRRSPMVTVASILSLAIGIGASAAVFSLADRLLLRRLAVSAPDELRVLRWRSGPSYPFSSLSGNFSGGDSGIGSTSFSLEALRRARAEAHETIDVFGFADLDRVSLVVNGNADLGEATAVSGNYFSVLQVAAAHGRVIGEADDRADASPAVVISDPMWRQRFNGMPDVVGRALVINGATFTVVGVTPPSFHGTGQVGSSPDVYVPIALRSLVVRDGDDPVDTNFWWVLMMGRLKTGADEESVRARLDLIVKQTVRAARPALADRDLPKVEIIDGSQGQVEVRDSMQEPLRMMSIVVGIVLLVACANVANLLLARGRARARELSVRIALGASRRRIVRQLLTEGVLLAGCGSALGLVATRWVASGLLPAVQSGVDPMTIATSADFRVVGFVAALASVCVATFAVVPALRATDVSLTAGLHEASRRSAPAQRRGLSAALVIVQIALSMMLVVTALLLVRSVGQLQQVDLGFDASNLLTFKVDPALNGYSPERVQDLYARVLAALRASPGVESATLSSHTLISDSSSITLAARSDEPTVDRASAGARAFEATHRAWQLAIDPSFFDTMRIRVERGRRLDERDRATSQRVAVVNSALAHQLFQSNDVVGRRFRTEMRADAPTYEIVGVCADARYTSLRRPKPPTMYVSYRQQDAGAMTFEVRTTGDPALFVSTAREIVRSIDAHVPMFRVQSQEQQIVASVRHERLFAKLAGGLGAVAVLLSAIGLYALLAYAVTLRTGEIGIRMALGAARANVRWMIVRHSLVVAAIGLAFGITAGIAGAGLLKSLLFNVAPRDAMSFALATVIMIVVTIIAGYVPAQRASRVDPLIALRAE